MTDDSPRAKLIAQVIAAYEQGRDVQLQRAESEHDRARIMAHYERRMLTVLERLENKKFEKYKRPGRLH